MSTSYHTVGSQAQQSGMRWSTHADYPPASDADSTTYVTRRCDIGRSLELHLAIRLPICLFVSLAAVLQTNSVARQFGKVHNEPEIGALYLPSHRRAHHRLG